LHISLAEPFFKDRPLVGKCKTTEQVAVCKNSIIQYGIIDNQRKKEFIIKAVNVKKTSGDCRISLNVCLQNLFSGGSNIHERIYQSGAQCKGWILASLKKMPKTNTLLTTLHFPRNLLIGPNKLVLHYTRLQRLTRDKPSSLLASVISYKENEVLLRRPLVSMIKIKFI